MLRDIDRSKVCFHFRDNSARRDCLAGLNSQIVLGCHFSLNARSIQFRQRDFCDCVPSQTCTLKKFVDSRNEEIVIELLGSYICIRGHRSPVATINPGHPFLRLYFLSVNDTARRLCRVQSAILDLQFLHQNSKQPIGNTVGGNSTFVARTFSGFEARTEGAGISGCKPPGLVACGFCGAGGWFRLLSEAGLHSKLAASRRGS